MLHGLWSVIVVQCARAGQKRWGKNAQLGVLASSLIITYCLKHVAFYFIWDCCKILLDANIMVRNYIRKTNRAPWCTEDLRQRARDSIATGVSIWKVAESLGIPLTMLSDNLKKAELPTSCGRFKRMLSEEMEKKLKEYCLQVDNRFFGLTLRDMRQLAYDFAEWNEVDHPFNKSSHLVGKDWASSFIKRHRLSLRSPELISIRRAMEFNAVQVNWFYDLLQSMLEQHQFGGNEIFNVDETGLSTVPARLPKVVSSKGKRTVNKVVSRDRRQTIMELCCFSASGLHRLPV